MKTSKKIVADICLYGTSRTGAGFIVCELKHGRTSGTGEPDAMRTFTEACWMGVGHLQALGVESGKVRIFDPSGERMSVVDVNNVPAFGDLK
jgi:hypothetical protein